MLIENDCSRICDATKTMSYIGSKHFSFWGWVLVENSEPILLKH